MYFKIYTCLHFALNWSQHDYEHKEKKRFAVFLCVYIGLEPATKVNSNKYNNEEGDDEGAGHEDDDLP